jgi:ATP-dependent Clp protease ATP-binding subunit ClpA
MQINTRALTTRGLASYSRTSQTVADQAVERQDETLTHKWAKAKEWGVTADSVDLMVRDNTNQTLSLLKESETATDTEKAIADVALWTGSKDMVAKFANQANKVALQAISGQMMGPAGLVVAKTALAAQQELKGVDAEKQTQSLERVFNGFTTLSALTKETQALAQKGLAIEGDATTVRDQRMDILTQMVNIESSITGGPGVHAELKRPRGIRRTEFLSKYGVDLTLQALEGKLGPFFGRDAESIRSGTILTRKTKNNAVFVGPAGVGKTAIAEKISLDCVTDANHPLNGKTIVQLDLAAMIAGTRYRGMFEERLKGVIDEATERKDIVLFIDELHTIMGAGAGQDSPMDASNILKPALARGDIQVLGSTTQDEYEKHILKDPAMARRFAPITIDETSQEVTVQILGVIKESFENHHGIVIPEALLKEIVEKADKGQPERYFPDKAIDLLDEAASSARIEGAEELKAEHVNKALSFMQKGAESLTRYGRDLTRLAEEGKLGPFTGRADETRSLERTLLRAGKNNPVMVGAGGVGKTAIVEKLAVDMLEPDHHLHGKKLIELSMTELLSGTGGRGEFEERMKQVLNAAKRDPNVVLFIDEIHTLMGAGGNGGALDAANMLKPALARGELTLVGATTLDEYRNYIAKDPALERRFDPIFVDELNKEEALEVIKAVSSKFERHHEVKMPEELMPMLIDAADKALPSRKRPDKAIDVLDLACSEAAMRGLPEVTVEIIDLIVKELKEKEEALKP